MKKVRKPVLASFAMLFAAVLFVGQGSRGESASRATAARTPIAGRYAKAK